jgi:hypothetical protein
MYGTQETSSRTDGQGGLTTPRRNRFFHGKMMDVYHFEMETGYGISMRRTLNRLVAGYGVLCGLDVVQGDDPCSVRVTPGAAIDGWGREIIVPTDSQSVRIPAALVDRVCGRDGCDDGDDKGDSGRTGKSEDGPEQSSPRDRPPDDSQPEDHRHHNGRDDDDDACVTVLLCYHECESDPVAVLAGDCSTSTPCAPSSIREQYRIEFEAGCTEPVEISCRFPDVLRRGELDYGALARWVTQECTYARNPCIPLANVRLDCRDGGCDINDIDIEIRPVVYGNDIILDILSRIVEESRPEGGDGRRRR